MPVWIKDNWFLLAFVGAIALAFLLLRSSPSNISTIDQLDALINSGRPTVLTFYSNF